LTNVDSAKRDERADIYSLGAILQFLVANRKVEKPLLSIVDKALKRDPSERYADVKALASDVAAYLDGLPVAAHPDSLLDIARRFLQKHQLAVGLVIAYAVVRLLIQIFFGG